MNLPLVGVYSVLFAVAWSAFCWVYRTLLTWSPHNKLGKAVSYFGGAVAVGVGMMMFSIFYSMMGLYFFSGSTVLDENILQQLLPMVYLAWVVGLFVLCYRIWKRILGTQITILSDHKHVNAWVICCVVCFALNSFVMTLSVEPPFIFQSVVLIALIAPHAIAFVRWKARIAHHKGVYYAQ
jgi:hypothetical protein